jgi:hypothetical protein
LKISKVISVLALLFASFLACAFYAPSVNAQGSDVLAQGDSFLLYQVAGGGFNFQHVDFKHGYFENRTVTIEVLTGSLNGSDARLGLTERGGNLFFHSNSGCEIQFSHNSGNRLRLDHDGVEFSVITAGTAWNGTIPTDTDVMIAWNFVYLMPHEENFNLYLGILGIILLIAGILLLVYSFRTYPIFTFSATKETVWEQNYVAYAIVCIIVGAGLIMTWLLM